MKGKDAANRTHHEVGAKVRQTIRELGGTMPEELPAAESIKKIETQQRKRLGKADKRQRRKTSNRHGPAPGFPQSPHAILDPGIRWFPADEALRESSMEKLMPPLVAGAAPQGEGVPRRRLRRRGRTRARAS